MDDKERQGRFETAAALLDVLKKMGCPASEVARELAVSTTTISHWRAVKSAKGRSVAAPSDSNLIKLLEIMRTRFIENLYSVHEILSQGYIGHTRLYQTVRFIVPHIDEAQERFEKQLVLMEKYQSEVKKLFSEAQGDEEPELAEYVANHNTKKWGPAITLADVPGDTRGEVFTKILKEACLPLPEKSEFVSQGLNTTLKRVRRLFVKEKGKK